MPKALLRELGQEGEDFHVEQVDRAENEESSALERSSLHLIKKQGSSELAHDHLTREQAGEFAEKLANNSQLIPPDKRTLLELKLVQDRILDNANKARTENFSSIRLMLEQHPEEAFLLKAYMEDAAVAFGFRLVDDKVVSESIRQARARMQKTRESGRLSRAISAIFSSSDKYADETAIIKQMETVAAELEGQRIALSQGAVELAEMEKKKQELLLTAAQEATRVIERENQEAERIRAEAKRERTELETANLELRRDNAVLEGIHAKLLANPDVSAVFDQKKELDRSRFEERILVQLEALKGEWDGLDTEEDYVMRRKDASRFYIEDSFKNLYQILESFKDKILVPLVDFETKFNQEERTALANKLAVEGKGVLNKEVALREMVYQKDKLKLLNSNFFFAFLRALADKKVQLDRAISLYDRLVEDIKKEHSLITEKNNQVKELDEKNDWDKYEAIVQENRSLFYSINEHFHNIEAAYAKMIQELRQSTV